MIRKFWLRKNGKVENSTVVIFIDNNNVIEDYN